MLTDCQPTQIGRRIVLGLGSNLGDRKEWILKAIREIRNIDFLEYVSCSNLYETPPAGGPPQENYYNAGVLIFSSFDPEKMMIQLLAIEKILGRTRSETRWTPRTIDIDILWIEGFTYSSEVLTVPHPQLLFRSFALRPLIELVPEARDPMTDEKYSEIEYRKNEMIFIGKIENEV